MTTSLRRPASDAALTHGFALLGDLLSLLVQRKLGKETHPGIRVSLRSTPLTPSLFQGHAPKGHPWPIGALAASMPLNPLRNDSVRPPEGGVWRRLNAPSAFVGAASAAIQVAQVVAKYRG